MSDERPPREFDAPLSGLADRMEPPPQLEERVIARLREQRLLDAGRGRGSLVPRLAWAASILVAFFFGLGLASQGGVPRANYLLLLDRISGPELSASELDERVGEYGAWARTLQDASQLVAGERLLAEGELIGGGASGGAASGFFLLSVDGEAEARRLAATCPHVRYGGSVSVQAIDVR